jgi:hypothetical protein
MGHSTSLVGRVDLSCSHLVECGRRESISVDNSHLTYVFHRVKKQATDNTAEKHKKGGSQYKMIVPERVIHPLFGLYRAGTARQGMHKRKNEFFLMCSIACCLEHEHEKVLTFSLDYKVIHSSWAYMAAFVETSQTRQR